MDVTLTEQIKLTFPSDGQRKEAERAFSAVTKRYAEACTYVSCYYFEHNCTGSVIDLHKVLYTDVRASYGLKSQMAISVFKTVLARYKTVGELMKQETVTYTVDGRHDTFRKSLDWLQKPVVFRRPQADLVRGRDWGFTAGMEMVSVNTLGKRIKCTYQCRPDSRLFDPAWKHGGAKLVFHDADRNWYLHISVTKAFPDTGRSRITEIYGHDCGLVNLVTSCGDNGETVFQDGQDVRRIKERYARTRASLQAKGTKGARRVLKRISGRENRMMSDVNHRISKTLVSGCRAGVLHVFEDLSGVSFQNLEDRNTSGRYELRSWTFYSLEMKTAYKAAMRRGAILKVDPRYTSQKCPGCGTIDKTARNHSQHRYTCKHCGRVYNDDEVAAKNLHQLGIWYISGVDNPHFSKKVSGY